MLTILVYHFIYRAMKKIIFLLLRNVSKIYVNSNWQATFLKDIPGFRFVFDCYKKHQRALLIYLHHATMPPFLKPPSVRNHPLPWLRNPPPHSSKLSPSSLFSDLMYRSSKRLQSPLPLTIICLSLSPTSPQCGLLSATVFSSRETPSLRTPLEDPDCCKPLFWFH